MDECLEGIPGLRHGGLLPNRVDMQTIAPEKLPEKGISSIRRRPISRALAEMSDMAALDGGHSWLTNAIHS